MRVFITGGTGLVGRRLVADRLERGDEVVVLSRDAARAAPLFGANINGKITAVQGDPAQPGEWQARVDGCDAVIHLAGAGIADRRWSAAYKKEMRFSRIEGTRQVVSAIERAAVRPRTLISASGLGYYGDQGERELNEMTSAGDDFLARLCVEWERQAMQAEKLGVRVVVLRIAMVLDERGGALKKLLLPFRLFAGGPIGSRKRFTPWIHWRDLIGLIDLLLCDAQMNGPVNVTAPQPIRQGEFARVIGKALGRPSFMPTPGFALRIAVGEMAGAIVASQRVIPEKAIKHGYRFHYTDLESALQSLLKQRASAG
jgi:uncharacterized protein (TIGR01777 family)